MPIYHFLPPPRRRVPPRRQRSLPAQVAAVLPPHVAQQDTYIDRLVELDVSHFGGSSSSFLFREFPGDRIESFFLPWPPEPIPPDPGIDPPSNPEVCVYFTGQSFPHADGTFNALGTSGEWELCGLVWMQGDTVQLTATPINTSASMVSEDIIPFGAKNYLNFAGHVDNFQGAGAIGPFQFGISHSVYPPSDLLITAIGDPDLATQVLTTLPAGADWLWQMRIKVGGAAWGSEIQTGTFILQMKGPGAGRSTARVLFEIDCKYLETEP